LKEAMVMSVLDMERQIIIADIITGNMIMVLEIQITTHFQDQIPVEIPVCIALHIEAVMNYALPVIHALGGHPVLIWEGILDTAGIPAVLQSLIVLVIRQPILLPLGLPSHLVPIFL